MYESFFGFRKRPFLAIPSLDRYFPSESMEQAFATVTRALTRGDGPVAILGPTGSGKTLLSLRIAETWRKNYDVVLLSSARLCTSRALLQSLLFELRMPYRDMSEGELRLSLTERLQPSIENASDGLILIVDEAQSLSLKLLEELRGLTNLYRDGQPRVRLVLVGSLRLDELLGHPRMESLNQRLSARCYLNYLSAQESVRYVRHKVELAGVQSTSVFTDDALRSIHKATAGIPRLIDQLADQVLEMAAEAEQRPISTTIVDRAWRQLQQLPTTLEPTSSTTTMASIEFGSLDDDEADEFDVEPTGQPTRILSSPTNAFEAISSASSFSYLDEEFGSSIQANAIEQNKLLRVNESIAPLNTSSHISGDALEIDEVFDMPGWSMHGNLRSPIASMGHIEADPFGTGFDEEIPLSIQPIANVASPQGIHRDPDLLLQPAKPSMNIPILDFEDEPVLAIENLEHEIREMITGLNYNSLEINLNAPIEWQSSFGPATYPVPSANLTSMPSSTQPTRPHTIQPTTPNSPSTTMTSSDRPIAFKLEPIASSSTKPINSTVTIERAKVNEPSPSAPRTRLKLAEEPASNASQDPTFHSQAHVLSFAKLGQQSVAIGDDRDLLIIEEEVAHPQNRTCDPAPVNQFSATPQASHSYVQLFSMLRG